MFILIGVVSAEKLLPYCCTNVQGAAPQTIPPSLPRCSLLPERDTDIFGELFESALITRNMPVREIYSSSRKLFDYFESVRNSVNAMIGQLLARVPKVACPGRLHEGS